MSKVEIELLNDQKLWLVTGAAGFIGSNLLEALLLRGQKVRAFDNLATGLMANLEDVKKVVGPKLWANCEFVQADICNSDACISAMRGVDHVLHQAALGSVPRSLDNPIASAKSNVIGFINMLDAARREGVDSFVYASSSSVYGDDPDLPRREEKLGKPLSPYALTKVNNEDWAEIYAKCYDFRAIGLRYFNVFGRRQDPNGAYAAVIPRWIHGMIEGRDISIFGDGSTTRDFCFIDNVVQANFKASIIGSSTKDLVFNIGLGQTNSLAELFEMLRIELGKHGIVYDRKPLYAEFRHGDVKQSLADTSRAQLQLNYRPEKSLQEGLTEVTPWYVEKFKS